MWNLFILAFLALFRRVFDHLNTVEQLVVGAIVGYIDALILNLLLYWKLKYLFVWITETKFGKMIRAENYCFRDDRDLDIRENEWFYDYKHHPEILDAKIARTMSVTIDYGIS